jgi:hypothetical protein
MWLLTRPPFDFISISATSDISTSNPNPTLHVYFGEKREKNSQVLPGANGVDEP